MFRNRSLGRLAALPVAAGLVLFAAGPASAHVTVTPSETAAGAFTVLTFSVPHGCDGSGTERLAIEVPEQILSVTPTVNPAWEVEKQMEQLDEPVEDAHGNQVTERVAQVVYTTDDPLPEGYRDTFELSLQLPDAAGETLVFPSIQTCSEGETAWVETAAAGEDAESLDAPAPVVTITEAEGNAHGAAEETSGEADEAASEADEATEAATEPVAAGTDDDSELLGTVGLVAGLLGLAAGVAALLQVRRRA